jgi:hypothetical protein
MTKLYSDEIGIPSSSRPWVPGPVIFLTLREEGRLNRDALPVVDTLPWFATTLPRGEPVIDLRAELLQLR